MALSDRLANPPKPIHGYPCSVGRALDTLPPTERQELLNLLGTPERRGKSASYIWGLMHDERRDLLAEADRLAENGATAAEVDKLRELAVAYDIGLQTVNNHRGGKCRCVK